MANVNIKVGYTVDKTGLNEIKKQLSDIRIEAEKAKMSGQLTTGLKEASDAASKLEHILNSAWNSKIGQLDLSKVNTEIHNAYGNVQNLQKALAQSGTIGTAAYNNFASAILNTNIELKQTSATLDKMAITLKNTIRYGISSSIFNNLTNSIQKAFDYSVKLDTSLTDIRIVTEKSADEMDRFAVKANQVAKDLGRSTKDFTEASLIYYQQGLSDEESVARAEVTMKAANVTGQTGREVSEQLTAVWNGYKVTAEEAELYVDKLAAVAAATAADLEELSTGMSKVASAANIMGVDIDQLNAQLATIVSVTRQAPESVGVALKTIYARMSDIKSGLDDETTLGNYTEKMAQYGINVLDANNNLRDMGKVIEEIGGKWETLSREQQVALAQTMAGTRQYNNLLSLFDNWDMYTDALNTSATAAGTLQKQQDIYMESTAAHLKQLSTEWERTYNTLFDKDATNALVDALTAFINQFNDFIEGLGGGLNALGNIGLQVANIFNKQIGSSIERQIENLELWKRNRDSLAMKSKVIEGQQNYSSSKTQEEVMTSHLAKGENISSGALDKEAGIAERLLNVRKALTAEEYKELTALQQQIGLEQTQLDKINQYNRAYKESASTLQSNKEYYEEELTQQEKLLTYLELGTKSQAEQGNQAARVSAIMEEIISENSTMNEMLAGMSTEQEEILELIQSEVLSDEQIVKLVERQKQLIEEQKNKIQETTNAIEAKQAFEDGTNIKLQEQIDKKEQIIATTERQAQRELSIQKIISTTTGLIQAASSIIGGLSVAFDGTSTASEKLNGYWSAGLGTLSSVANILLPGSGIIVQGVGAIAKGVLEMTGLWDDWEDSLKSSEERMKELKDTMDELKKSQKEMVSQYDDAQDAIEYFEDIEERFKTLQNLAEKGLLTSTLRSEYETYLKKVQTYNDEALITYDSQGKKIAQNSKLIEDTIKKLQKENELLLQSTYSNENWGTLSETFQKQYKEIYNTDTINSMGADAILALYGTGIDKYMSKDQMKDLEKYFSSKNILKYSQDPEAFVKNFNNMLGPLNDAVIKELQSGEVGDAYYTWSYLQTYLDQYEEKLKEFGEKFEDIRINSVDFLNYLKYNKDDSKNYEKLSELGIQDLDNLLINYIDGINIGLTDFQDKYGNLDADKIKAYLIGIEQNLVDLFASANGEDLMKIYEEAVKIDAASMSSQAYEDMLISMVEEFLSNIKNEETFNKVKDLLPELFGLKGISAEWKDGKAQLGKNGGNIVTQGEDISRNIGKLIAELNVGKEGNKEKFARNIEQYLQDNLNEIDLQNLDATKLANDFNDLLYNAIDENTGDLRAGLSMEDILQNAIDQQLSPAAQLNNQVSSAMIGMKDDIDKFDLDEEDLKGYTKHIMEMADEAKELADTLEEDADAAAIVAKSVLRMNRGIESLADNFEDWNDILKKSSKSSAEYWEALDGMKDAVADLLDVEKDAVGSDFIEKHLKEIEKAAEGNAKAIEELRDAYADDILINFAIKNGLSEELQNELLGTLNDIQSRIPTLEIGAIDDSSFIDSCQKLIENAGLTVDQANSLFDALGFDAEFLTEEKDQEQRVPRIITKRDVTAYDEFGNPTEWVETSHQDGFDTFTGKVDTFAMATNGRTPQITSLVKKATGGMNNWSSSNKGGKGPGSGSGGGGSKSKEPDKIDPLEKEADRYHDVDVQLDLIDKDLDKLDKQKKKLFGQDLINNLNKRLSLLNKQIDTTNEKIRIAQGETQELRDKLGVKGVSFNADGTITNYAQAYASQLNYVNSIIAQYNSMSAEAQEGFKDTVEKAKEDFDKFVENIDRYDELITDMIPGLEADIQEAIDEKIDLQIEKFDMEIEIRLDLAEAERDWNDFKKRIIDGIEDDDILGNAMAKLVDFSSYYKEDNTGIVQALRKQVDNTLAELNAMDTNGWSQVYGDNRTAALDDLKKYYEELMSNLTDVLELQKEIHESYIDMMDEAQEKFDEQIEAYEMISDLIEHDMEVISLVYGEESYGQLAKYYDKQQQNFNSQLDFQRQQADFWRQQLDTLEEGSDEWENARDKWKDAVQSMNDLIEESIQNLQDKYLNAINLIFQNLNNKITDNLGLEYIEEEWNLINQNADQYLDTINSLYEVQKLEGKYLDALDQTDSISAQRQLKKIMDEELADLRERDKLTQYDIERANKKYEIALKQIALQEAQQNKSKMRLRRDSQGNYRYEYTSDADQVGQLQDELNDMYNSLYNFDKSRYQENLNQMYSVWVEFQEKMAEAAQINDPVARSERELLLQTQYEQLINGLTEQNATVRNNLHESAFDDLSRLYDIDVANFQNMSDEEKNTLMSDLIPYWESGIQHMTDVFAGDGGFLGVCKNAFEQLHDATKDYEDGLDELENTGRIDFESIGEGIDENIDRTQQLISDNTELINTYEQQLTAIQNVITQLDGLIDKYNAAKDAAVAATKAAYEYWSEQQRQAAAAAGNANGGSGSGNGNSGSESGSGSGSGGGAGSALGGDGNLIVGETATYSGKYYYDSYGSSPTGSKYSGVANGIVIDRITNNPYGIHIHSADGRYRDLGWVKKSQLSGYDTGGYTGEWGSDGRLALLHQKELVLNKEDTANMLNAISIMRNITNMLGSSVLGKLAAATAGGLGTEVGGDVLEQNVHIDAQFPNVKDSREIEEALNNLVNMASMRANRR